MKPERTHMSSALCCFALVFVRSGVYVYHPKSQGPFGRVCQSPLWAVFDSRDSRDLLCCG